jgi:hypothetical protein
MVLQTSITQFQKPGARGLIAKAEARNLISRTLAQGKPNIYFGVPVYRGATDDVVSPTAADGDFLGLSRRSGLVDPASGGDFYTPGDEVPIMMEGVMWVETAGAVVQGVRANYDTTTRLFTAAAVGGSVIAAGEVEFDTSTTAAGLAIVRVKRSVPA